jgi:hypothetical protein
MGSIWNGGKSCIISDFSLVPTSWYAKRLTTWSVAVALAPSSTYSHKHLYRAYGVSKSMKLTIKGSRAGSPSKNFTMSGICLEMFDTC